MGSKYNIDEIKMPKIPFIETKTINIEFPQEKIYLSINEKYELTATVTTSTNEDMSFTWVSDETEIISLEENIITGLNSGSTTVKIQTEDNQTKEIEVVVSSLITLPEVNSNKSFLPCQKYTKEEADLLDEILFSKIDAAGYGTRSGPVAAARFLLLEFPYTIKYFNENGRLNNHKGSPKVDG